MSNIILASKSPYRKELLSRILHSFEVADSLLDESILKESTRDLYTLPEKLAQAKAQIIFKKFSDSIVIGSDQICLFQSKALGKPKTAENAFKMLKALQGNAHQLITSYAILTPKEQLIHTNITKLYMRKLDDNMISAYLEQDSPLDCAGSYKLEKKGISLFEKIECQDHTAIMGLPLIALSTDLMKLGIKIL